MRIRANLLANAGLRVKEVTLLQQLLIFGVVIVVILILLTLISSNWDLKSFFLDTAALYKDHTGQNIADAKSDIFDNWNLGMKKLVATTIDNASNMIAAFSLLDLLRLSCFGHNLDLAINKGLDYAHVQLALVHCHSLFHHS